MRECDNSKIHISNNSLLSICLLIMLDTLLQYHHYTATLCYNNVSAIRGTHNVCCSATPPHHHPHTHNTPNLTATQIFYLRTEKWKKWH